MSAPSSTSAREPDCAPAASNSLSAMEAPSPAPCSTATFAPRATNFFTVSGIAAQRVSPADSFRTAIFIRLFQDQKNDEADDQTRNCAQFQHPCKTLIIGDVNGDFLRRRARQQRFFFFGHVSPFARALCRGVHNKASGAAQVPEPSASRS